jgi:hypothetical protein
MYTEAWNLCFVLQQNLRKLQTVHILTSFQKYFKVVNYTQKRDSRTS